MLSVAPSASSLPVSPPPSPLLTFFYLMADTKGLTQGDEKGPGFTGSSQMTRLPQNSSPLEARLGDQAWCSTFAFFPLNSQLEAAVDRPGALAALPYLV